MPAICPYSARSVFGGAVAAEGRAKGPKGVNGRAVGGPSAKRERWKAWQTIAKTDLRRWDALAGGGAHTLALAFGDAECAITALKGLSCIASGLAVTELSGHVYTGDAWGLVADITDAAAAALESELYGCSGA